MPVKDYQDCHVSSHYPASGVPTTHTAIHDFLKLKHRNTIPYSSSATDVWDAMNDVDKGVGVGTVHLVYANKDMDSDLQAAASGGWNREHLWPKR